MDNAAYEAQIKPIYTAYDSLETANKALTPDQQQAPEFKKQYNKAEKGIEKRESAINKAFVLAHPDSYVSLMTLESYAYGADYVDIALYIMAFHPWSKQTDAA